MNASKNTENTHSDLYLTGYAVGRAGKYQCMARGCKVNAEYKAGYLAGKADYRYEELGERVVNGQIVYVR